MKENRNGIGEPCFSSPGAKRRREMAGNKLELLATCGAQAKCLGFSVGAICRTT